MPSVRRLIIVALLGGALALAACGGGDRKAAGEAASSTAANYRVQLTKLCVDSARGAAQISPPRGANGAALADYFDELSSLVTKREKQFDGLRPPADLRDEQSQLARTLVQDAGAIRRAAAGFRSGRDLAVTYQTFTTSYNAAVRRRNALVKQLKVPKCQEAQLGSSVSSTQGSF